MMIACPVGAQAQENKLGSIEDIEAEFQKDIIRAEVARIQRLGALAGTQTKSEASKTYAEALRFAIGIGQYKDAEDLASKVIASEESAPETLMLAQLVTVIAKADRGDFEGSLKSLAESIQTREAEEKANPTLKGRRPLPLPAKLSLINAYTQRLIHNNQFAVAQKALGLIRDTARDNAVKNLAITRLAQIELVGKPAPAIKGTDIDGKVFDLHDFDGKVTLIVFWASWCVPNSQELAHFDKIAERLKEKGFRVVGINVDGLQDGATTEIIMPNIRRFLLDHNVKWPNLLNGTGERDFAKAYEVTEIPFNVLVGRDGKIINLDLRESNLLKTLNSALAK
jgi:thiol-disulfide isomerase/thioredoxin